MQKVRKVQKSADKCRERERGRDARKCRKVHCGHKEDFTNDNKVWRLLLTFTVYAKK